MTRHRTADLEPTSFGGRYTLVRRLAIGGMAEIYLARQARVWNGPRPADAPDFEKEVVIKRLRAEHADDPRIVEMFLDEARIGALLNHPNVVHVYDVDEHDGIPYIAMEYIVGEELNELCRRGIAQSKFLPLEHAVELMRQAAAGLGYFHSKRGSPGTSLADQPLDIVHLDISPSNLLVTQDGFLKVIDFGISRARGRTQHDSVIPGKLSYMSPEQASRGTIDHRSDIFSLGIVLYEITVGKRLFRGPAREVVERLTAGKLDPPTFTRRDFPTALEAIVMRALERHPEDRYQNAYDLADDLESFLRDERLHSGPVRIARYLDQLAAASGGERRPELAGEADPRERRDDLDFDRQIFDGYVPREGGPGPAQAPDWEDAEQPEGDVARALGLELSELRALRSPVPTRPSGVMWTVPARPTIRDVVEGRPATGGKRAVTGGDDDEFGGTTAIDPASAARAGAVAPAVRDSGDVDVELDTNPTVKQDVPTSGEAAAAVASGEAAAVVVDEATVAADPVAAAASGGEEAAAPEPPPAVDFTPGKPAGKRAGRAGARTGARPKSTTRAPRPAGASTPGAPAAPAPVIGASMLQSSAASRLPWLVVAALGLAVLALVAYIAIR